MKPYSKKYFADYEAVQVPDGRGGVKKTLRYTGPVYHRNLDGAARRRQKVLFAIAAALCDVAFLLAVTRNIQSNYDGPLAALGLGLIFPLFFFTAGCLCNIWRKPDMTQNEYRSSALFIRYGALAAALLGLVLAIWHGVYTTRHGLPGEFAASCLATACYGAVAMFSAVVCFFEWKTSYVVTPGQNGKVEPTRHHD